MLVLHFFLAEVHRVVRIDNLLIRFRIEICVINPVYNASQITFSGPKQTVKALSIKGCLDFLRISAAYRCHSISIHDPAL